jgi:hypothetical protein
MKPKAFQSTVFTLLYTILANVVTIGWLRTIFGIAAIAFLCLATWFVFTGEKPINNE